MLRCTKIQEADTSNAAIHIYKMDED